LILLWSERNIETSLRIDWMGKKRISVKIVLVRKIVFVTFLFEDHT